MVQQAGIFELRFYKIAHGREGDMLARVQQDWNVLFPRHGIRPLGCWTAVSAKTLPMFVYITPFKDMADREACWAGFYADTDWHEARTRTNAGSELVERYDICFVRGLGDFSRPAARPGEIDEIVLHQTLVGKGGPAGQALLTSETPAAVRAGATAIGHFDVINGIELPGAVSFLRWPDWETRKASVATIEADEALRAERNEQRKTYGATLVGGATSYLLNPVEVDWQ